MAINYTGVDLDRYNAGNKFYSQDRFLQGIGLDKPAITFNPSRSNTGIMSQYPRYPIIPQYGGDGDGGPPPGPRDLGEITADNYGKGVTDPTGMGYELTDEDKKNIQQQKNVNALRSLGKFGLLAISPFGPGITFGIGKGVNKIKNIFSGGNDGDGGVPDNVVDAGGTYTGGYHSNEGGFENTSSDGNTSTNSSQEDQGEVTAAEGGRIGYSGGGLSRAQIVSLKNLGYDIDKRGMEPFGGVDILKDILRLNKYAYGGRAGYKDGYSVQDDMTDYATNVGKEASPGGGFENSGGDNNSVNNINIPTGTPNLNFTIEKEINPAFNYAGNFGKFGGILDLSRTIQEEEPVGNIGYLDPSGNFGIGFNTDLGVVGNANLGNLNIGYTGQDGFNTNYMGGFAGDAGRFGANYGKDGLEARVTYNKKFNNGGIVGLYR